MIVEVWNGSTRTAYLSTAQPNSKQTTPLDRVGAFSFTCSASDPQIAQLVNGRTVYGYEMGVLKLSGTVDEIKDATVDGVPSKAVSGADLTRELTDAYIARLALSEAGWSRVVSVFDLKIHPAGDEGAGIAPGQAIDGPNDQASAYDANPATYAEESTGSSDWWWTYIGAAEAYTKLHLIVGDGGGVTGPLSGQYFNKTEWVDIPSITDGTASGGNTFQVEGDVEFTLVGADEMGQTTEQGRAAYFTRWHIGTTSNAARLYDTLAWGHVPTDTALALIAAQFPTVANGYAGTWTLDTTNGLSATVKTDVFDTLTRVSVYEALLKLTELTGEHFYCTPDRKVVWIGNTNEAAASGGSTVTETIDIQVSASADDGDAYNVNPLFRPAYAALAVGRGANVNSQLIAWMRFASLPVPQGAEITAAYMQWHTPSSEPDNPSVVISAEDVDNAAAPTDQADVIGKARTTANATYDMPDSVVNTWYDTPSLVSVVQEIVDRPGWISGNAIQFLIDNAGTSNNVFRSISTFDSSSPFGPPRLHVEYTVTHAAAPLRICSPPVPSLVEDNPSIALLSNLKITTQSRETKTRAYPVGAGLGDGSLDLTYATMTMPAGFVMNTAENYIRLDPEGTRKDGYPDFKDLAPPTADLRARQNGANAVAATTLVWLGRHSAANVSYEVECLNLAAGVVKPGMKVWVDYQQWVDGQLVMNVNDQNLIVLEITDTITESATVTTGLKVATLAAWPISDKEYLIRLLRNQRAMSATPQAVGIGDVRTHDFEVDSRPFGSGGGGLARTASDQASGGGGGGGMSVHELTSGWHSATGLTPGDVLTATGATAYSFQTPSAPALADHDHSGDAGDGGTFDAANLTSGAATDGQVATADGAGGVAWEDPPAGGVVDAADVTYTPAVATDWDGDADPGDADQALDQLAERVDDLEAAGGGGAPTDYPYLGFGANGTLSAEVDVQAQNLTNEIMGWPPYAPAGTDLDANTLWWRKVGTPTTAPTVTLVAGEGGVTETFERCIKVVTDAASEGCETLPWTYADEPRVKSGRKLSSFVYVWCVGGVGVTVKLLNSDATETAATMVTAAAWTAVEVPNHTLAGTSCKLQFIADGAGTFYVAQPSANIGSRGFPLGQRPIRFVNDGAGAVLVNDVDPGGAASTDVDITAATSPLAFAAMLTVQYLNANAAARVIAVRGKWHTHTALSGGITTNISTTLYGFGRGDVWLNDLQVFQYLTSGLAANVEHTFIYLIGYWEWA